MGSKHLKMVTAIPTAAGREGRVVAYLKQWVKSYRSLVMETDAFGNLTVRRRRVPEGAQPIYLTAHLDHPAFVVEQVENGREALLRFRGGVKDDRFVGSAVSLWGEGEKPEAHGRVTELLEGRARVGRAASDLDQLVRVTWNRSCVAEVGQLVTWRLPAPRVKAGLFYAPVCDDLAAVAAALDAYERLLEKPQKMGDVRLLFTLAEEVGFVGAMEACRLKTIPRDAWLINLENSACQPETPVGGGPVLRVGDRISAFDSDLLLRADQVVQKLQEEDPAFTVQRRLMPGGACESTAFQLMGYRAFCVCFALGHYHNHGEEGGIAPEYISVADYGAMVRLLAALATGLPEVLGASGLKRRLVDRAGRLVGIVQK